VNKVSNILEMIPLLNYEKKLNYFLVVEKINDVNSKFLKSICHHMSLSVPNIRKAYDKNKDKKQKENIINKDE